MATKQCFQASYLHALTRQLFMSAGAPRHIAQVIAEILINANLSGHDSHGVLHVSTYLSAIDSGSMDPAAEPSVVKETDQTLILESNNGSGLFMAKTAMQHAIEKAKKAEVCRVSFVRGHHIGRLGEYAEMAARAGCIGILTSGRGGGERGGDILPFGGALSNLGTNPIAVGVPTGDDAPFVLDFATSVIAGGKVLVAKNQGEDLPEGCIVDKDGNPSVDPDDFLNGGHLLAFGGHKGYALSLLTCLLGGLSGDFNRDVGEMRGVFMQVMDVEAFTPLQAYQQGVRALLDGIKAIPPAPDFEEVLVPGDYEHNTRQKRLELGIEVSGDIYRRIEEWADKLEVSLSQDLVEPADIEQYRSA